MTQHRDLADELLRRSGFKQSPRISFGSDGSLDDPESIKARIFQIQAKKFKAEEARARAERDDEIAFLKSKLKEAGHAMDSTIYTIHYKYKNGKTSKLDYKTREEAIRERDRILNNKERFPDVTGAYLTETYL
jgi:hypothetical protein